MNSPAHTSIASKPGVDTMAKEETEDTSKPEPKSDRKASKRISELEKQLEEAQQKAGEYLELAQHAKADFENFRRRTEREAEDRRRYAALDLVKDLLNVVDDLGRALEHADPSDSFVSGVAGVRDNLMKILEAQGVKEIPTDGKFDPAVHEALAIVDGDTDGDISMVAQKGYTMHDKVIRYAKVVVTKKKEEPAAPEPEEGPADRTIESKSD